MKGRWTLACLLTAGLALLVFFSYTNSVADTLSALSVRTMPVAFYDVVTITSAAESYSDGFDPIRNNPRDPGLRQLNYPRVWHLLFLAGLNASHTRMLGFVFIILFLAGVFAFSGPLSHGTAVYLAAMVFSPAVLLGAERGNSDLVIFFLLSMAAWSQKRSYLLALAFILGAFSLKLYPIFAAVSLIKESPRQRKTGLIIVVVFVAIYVGLNFQDLIEIYRGTPKARTMSYGIQVFAQYFEHKCGIPLVGSVLRGLSYLGAAFAIGLSWWIRRRQGCLADIENTTYLDAFRIGAAVYVGTFVLGNNYDYRLMFLILTVPQILAWMRNPVLKRLSVVVAVAMMIAVWSLFIYDRLYPNFPYGNYIAFVLDEAAAWTVFVGLIYLQIRTLPLFSIRKKLTVE